MRPWDAFCLVFGLQCLWCAYLVVVSAQTTSSHFICSTECSEQEGGPTSNYNFSIVHRLTSAVNERAALVFLLTGTATVQGYAGCNYELRLADVDFSEMRDGEQSVRQTKLEQKLSQNPLRFGKSASGLISDVCPVTDEEAFALNIKLAILSHLQWVNDSEKVPITKLEDDISGRCVTNYEPIQDAEGRVLVRRTKSVSECSRRYASELTPNTADPSLFKALIESMTVSGVQTCDLTPDADGSISSVECSERLTIDGGFDAGSSQLNTLSMASKLVRLPTTNSGPLTPDKGITFRRTAFAPSPSPVPTAKREYREINEAVVLIKVMLRTDDWSGAANFLKLIEILRSFSLEELSELYSMFAKNNEALQLIFQAAAHVKTEDAFNFLKTGITEGYFIAPAFQLGMLEDPSISQIVALKEALLATDFQAYALATSTLVYKFCQRNKDCLDMPSMRSIIEELQSHLGTSCACGDMESSEKVLFTLRAIGNLGSFTDGPTLYPTLSQCLKNRSSAISIRASVAESFRRFGCNQEVDTILMESMSDASEDWEVRIQAYRSWARCLTIEKLKALADLMRRDESQQLESFVAQHLQSLLKSDDLSKRHNLKINRNEFLSLFGNLFKWIPMDLRRYSGYLVETFTGEKMAGKVEAVTIAGSVSSGFRYASLNFNINVKGREFNLLEVGYRHLLITPLSSPSLWELPPRPTFQNSWEKINQYDNIVTIEHHTPAVFTRINGNEVAYTWMPMIPLMLMKEATRWLSRVQLDEKTEFVTSGGLSLQVSTLLATANRLSKERALPKSYLELDTRLSYEVQSKTAFLLPTGPVGFRTDDRVYASLDFAVGNNRSENQFDFIYRGSDSKKPLFKYARTVTAVGYHKEKTVNPAGEYVRTTAQTPKLFDTLLGLVATYEQNCRSQEGPCISRELMINKNDGLAFSYYSGSKQLIYGTQESLRLAVSRPQGKAEVPSNGSLLHVGVEHLVRLNEKTEWNILVKAPWNEIYRLQVYKSADGNYTGTLELGSWKADLSGTWKTSLTDEVSATVELRSKRDQIWAVYNFVGPFTYSLRAVGKGKTLAFNLKSGNKHVDNVDGQDGDQFLLSHETEFRSPKFGECHLQGRIENKRDGDQRISEKKIKISLKRQKWKTTFSGKLTSACPDNWTARELKWKNELTAAYEQTGMKSLMVNCGAKLKLIEDSNLLISRKQITSKFWLENTVLPSLDSTTVFGYEDEKSLTPGRLARKEASLNITIPSAGIDSSFGFSKATQEPGSSAGTMAALTVWAWRDPKTPGLNLNYTMTSNKRMHYVFALIQYPGKLDYSLTSVVDMKARQHILNITHWSQPIINAETYFGFTFGESIHLETLTKLELFSSSSYQLQMSVIVGNGLRQLEMNQTCVTMGTVPSTLYTTNVSMNLMPDRKMNGRALFDIPQLPWWIIANPTAGKSNRLTAKLNGDGSKSLRFSLEGEAADSSTMKFKFKADKQETEAGDVSVMLAVVPGQPTETLKGIFYKSTSQYAFTETEHACSHEGEWNGNRGYAPGMPFRFGIQYKHQPDFRQGSINVYAEDTNLGKATDFELAEALYEYSVKGLDGGVKNDGVYQLNSEYMLNWRRYLSRGVEGTQGFLNANLSQDFMQGELSFSTHLTDFAQSSLGVSMNYAKKENNLLVTSNAQLEGSPVYIAELNVEESGNNRTIDFFLETTKTAEVKAANLTASCSLPEDINQACPLTYKPAPRISAKHFLQVSFIDGLRQTQLKSNLLKDPIFIETSKTGESEAIAIYRGMLEDRSDPIAIASYELAYSGPQESKRQLRLEKGGKVYTVSDLRTVGEWQVQNVGNFSINGKEGTYDFLYIPDRLFRGKISGPLLLQMEMEDTFGLNTGGFFLTIHDKQLSSQGSWLFQKSRPVVYLRLDTNDRKRVLKAAVTDAFNVSVEELSWSEDAKETQQDRLTVNTRCQLKLPPDGVLNGHIFIRPRDAFQLALKELETAIEYINGGISAYFDEDLKSLLLTQMNQFLEELNQTAVSELYQGLTPKNYRQLAPQIIDQLGRLMDGWMTWTTKISRSGKQLLGALYGEWQRFAEATTGFMYFSAVIIHNDLERIFNEMPQLATIISPWLQTLNQYHEAITEFWTKNVLPTYRKGLASVSQQIPTIKSAQDYLKTLADDTQNMILQLAESVFTQTTSYLEKEFGPAVSHFAAGDIGKGLAVYMKLEMSSLQVDLEGLTWNATHYLPLRVQKVWRALFNCRNQDNWLERVRIHLLRKIPNAVRLWSPIAPDICYYNAWVFLPSDGRIRILTFDGEPQSFVPKSQMSYLLLRDFFEREISLTMEIGPDEAYFNLYLDRSTHIRLRHTGEPGKVYEKTTDRGNTIIYEHNEGFWTLYVQSMQFRLLFDLEEGILRVSAGLYWHGRFMGLLRSNDLEIANDRVRLKEEQTFFDFSSWRTSSSLKSEEKKTIDASEVNQIFKEPLQRIPVSYRKRFITLAKAGSQSQNDTNISSAHVTRVLSALNRLEEDKCPSV